MLSNVNTSSVLVRIQLMSAGRDYVRALVGHGYIPTFYVNDESAYLPYYLNLTSMSFRTMSSSVRNDGLYVAAYSSYQLPFSMAVR